MSKISELTEQELEYVLKEITFEKIWDILHNKTDWNNENDFVVHYSSDHPILGLSFISWKGKLAEKPERKNLELDYHDLLDLLKIHNDRAKCNDILMIIEGNLKYGYVFAGYDEKGKPLFHFADNNTYKFIIANKDNKRGM